MFLPDYHVNIALEKVTELIILFILLLISTLFSTLGEEPPGPCACYLSYQPSPKFPFLIIVLIIIIVLQADDLCTGQTQLKLDKEVNGSFCIMRSPMQVLDI